MGTTLKNILHRFVRALGRPAKHPKPPLPDNPYRRFYTKNRTFEELTRPHLPKK